MPLFRSLFLVGATLVLAAGCGGSSLGSGESCTQLMDAYATAYTAALVCTPGAANQCQQPTPALTCDCGGTVQDATEIDAIAAQLRAKGCIPAQAAACPCAFLGPISCQPADGGGGVCAQTPPGG
jgi:hypothetical protein